MPFNSPFRSLTFSRYVRLIFHVCPVLSLRVISLHLPSRQLVSLCFVSLSFPLRSPCFHFCPLHVPVSSPLFPFHFPLRSCHVDFLFPPLISLHFLAFPLCSPIFAAKNTGFPAFSQLGRPKTQSFSRFSAKGGRNPRPAKSRQGESSLGPLSFYTGSPEATFSGTSSNCRAVRGGGGGYPLSSTRQAMSADISLFRLLPHPAENNKTQSRAPGPTTVEYVFVSIVPKIAGFTWFYSGLLVN